MEQVITKEQKYEGFIQTSEKNAALYQENKVGVIIVNKEGTVFTPTELSIDDFEDNYIVCSPNDKIQRNKFGLENPGWSFVLTRSDSDELKDHHTTGVGPVTELQ